MEKGNNHGAIRITDDVVAMIANLATQEVKGIYGMSSGITEGITNRVMGRQVKTGLKVEVGEQEAIIDLKVIVYYGVKIDDVCRNLQQRVKDDIETMTGLKVLQVNVRVEGVQFYDEQEEVVYS